MYGKLDMFLDKGSFTIGLETSLAQSGGLPEHIDPDKYDVITYPVLKMNNSKNFISYD